jgi:hypothetical protein
LNSAAALLVFTAVAGLEADHRAATLAVTMTNDLHDGAIIGAAPVAVSAPAGTLTPFGFSVYPDGTAVITPAHSSKGGTVPRWRVRIRDRCEPSR